MKSLRIITLTLITSLVLSTTTSACSIHEAQIVEDNIVILVDYSSSEAGLKDLFAYLNYTDLQPKLPFLMSTKTLYKIFSTGHNKNILPVNFAATPLNIIGCHIFKKYRIIISFLDQKFC